MVIIWICDGRRGGEEGGFFLFFLINLFIFIFIFGCVRSSFLCEGFL